MHSKCTCDSRLKHTDNYIPQSRIEVHCIYKYKTSTPFQIQLLVDLQHVQSKNISRESNNNGAV